MASFLDSNKMGCASLACRIIANLQLAAKLSFFSSHVTSKRREAQKCFDDFCSFIQSIIEESPASLQVLQVAFALTSEKVGNENLMLNLSFLHAAAHSDFGLEAKSKEELEKIKNDFDDKECFAFAKRFFDNLNRL